VVDATDVPRSASIVIVTRNRIDDLRTALESATAQLGDPEVLVIDDGSTDGTPEMVARTFPQVRLVRSDEPRGYIVQRNRAAEMASGDVVVSLDDDARFSSEETVQVTLAEFSDPRIAAVAMPLIHTARGPDVLQRPPSDDGIWLTNAYIGTAHAVRRDVFLALGGYREQLEHFFEEPDFCVRLMRAGYVVRLGRAGPILHQESPRRSNARGVRYLCRNHVLFTWYYVPFPQCVPRFAALTMYGFSFGLRLREPVAALQGLVAAVREIASRPAARVPLSRQNYRRWRTLRRRPGLLQNASGAGATR
jgi:glycosyltransferase involved in cell wall biosynthesis